MLFSLLKHYLDLYISDTALKVFRSLYCFTTSICHGVENCYPRLWGTGISDSILTFKTTFYSKVTLPFDSFTVALFLLVKPSHITHFCLRVPRLKQTVLSYTKKTILFI